MSAFFTHHLNILPATQRALWPQLKAAPNLGFVLYGGTAIALRLGHRTSVDFDFFTDCRLNARALYLALPFLQTATVLQEQPNALTILVTESQADAAPVKISFFGGIDFGRVDNPQMTEDSVLRVASLHDLMATKLKVVLQRVEAKDYRDIAALIASGVDLAQGLAAARALYGRAFQPSEGLKALVYFQGGDLRTLSAHEKDILIQAVKAVRRLPIVPRISNKLSD